MLGLVDFFVGKSEMNDFRNPNGHNGHNGHNEQNGKMAVGVSKTLESFKFMVHCGKYTQ